MMHTNGLDGLTKRLMPLLHLPNREVFDTLVVDDVIQEIDYGEQTIYWKTNHRVKITSFKDLESRLAALRKLSG